MGPYCQYCGRRCFLLRVLKDGQTMLLATCDRGMKRDLASCEETHETALNPVLQGAEVAALIDRLCGTLEAADGVAPGLACEGRSAGQPMGETYCLYAVDHPPHPVPKPDPNAGLEFVVQSNYGYGHGWEDTAVEQTREAGEAQLALYRESQPEYSHRLVPRRVDTPATT